MSGQSNLKALIREMRPVREPGEFVFCTIEESQLKDLDDSLLIFREREGPTVIVPKDVAEQHGFEFDSIWGFISLSIHSNLEAVGFLAAVTGYLAKAGISVNVVSAFYHDHLFVPYNKVEEVLSLLKELAESYLE